MSNTNEELAMRIQDGDTSLYAQLWAQTEKLLKMMVNSFFRKNEELIHRRGIELEDLEQAAFLALVYAVKGYDPEAGLKLTTYLKYALKNEIRAALDGGRRRSRAEDPLNGSASLNQPISGEEDDPPLHELYPDPAAEAAFNAVDDLDERRRGELLLWGEVNKLPGISGAVITSKYREGLTYVQTSEKYGLTIDDVKNEVRRGIFQLRRNRKIKSYYSDYISYYRGTGLTAFRNTGTSSVERTVFKLDELKRRQRKNKESVESIIMQLQ